MNRFINKILKETEEDVHDDLFFQPKNIENREEEEKRKQEEFLKKIKEKAKIIFPKIKLGIQNVKVAQENKEWETESEELFLKIFYKLHINEKYDKWWNGYFLLNEKNIRICIFDAKYDTFWFSYDDIWRRFERRFHWKYYEVQLFMEQMLNEYFKLYGLILSTTDKRFFKN